MSSAGDARESPPSGPASASRLSVVTLLQAAVTDIRRHPRWLVPFTVAGLVVALADWIRTTDPIPMVVPASFQDTLSVQYSIVPMGTHRTVRVADALVDLRLPYLAGAVGLELLVLFAVCAAGYLTLQRALRTTRGRSAALRYGLLVVFVGFLPEWLGTAHHTFGNLLIGLVAIGLFTLIAVRLFLLPGFVVLGESFRTAIRRSRHRSHGLGWTLVGLIVVVGVSSWGLAQIPLVGGFLSTAIVAPVHAITLGLLVRRTGRVRQS